MKNARTIQPAFRFLCLPSLFCSLPSPLYSLLLLGFLAMSSTSSSSSSRSATGRKGAKAASKEKMRAAAEEKHRSRVVQYMTKIRKPNAAAVTSFRKHTAKKAPIDFAGALVEENEDNQSHKLKIQIDDDAANQINCLVNQFSMNVDFKGPVKQNGQNWFVTGSVEETKDEKTGEKIKSISDNIIGKLMGNLVVAKGYLKTYDFNGTDEDGNKKRITGCSLKIQKLELLKQEEVEEKEAESDSDGVDNEEAVEQ